MQRAERPCPTPLRASRKASEKRSFLWDEENRLLAVNNNGSVSCYFYDAAGERTVKLTSETEMVHVNGKKVGGNANICKFIAYVSPYFVVSNGGAYTKHIYAADQRIASKLGNIDGFGADPRRVEQAGGKKYDDNQSGTIKARFEALNIDYSDGNGKKDDEEYEPTMDSEEKENLVFFYHPDHLGSTSYVTDADGNIAQHIEYIPYGEVFVEERNSQFSTNYLFNAKELDNETGLYYYGARYLDPTGAMWLSVDPLFEKYAGMSPYNYCAGNPVKMVDPDGRELKDILKGAVAAINDNIMLGTVDYRGRMGRQAVDASHYNLGLTIGDCLSVLIGSGEIGTGSGMMAQGVVVTGASVSGGFTAPLAVVGVGEVTAGAALTGHGVYMAAQGMSNIANKKGHLDESSKTNSTEKATNVVGDKFTNLKNYVKKNGKAPDGFQGGSQYQNDGRGGGQVLPKFDKNGNAINYREWDVDPKVPGTRRNADRVVSGSDGSFWKTTDHYKTFEKIE